MKPCSVDVVLAYLLQGLSLGLSAAASPGPFQAFVIGRALQQGWRRTLPAALAPLLSDGPIIALTLLLLTSIPAGLLRGIQIAGGLYVLYLAWKSWLSFRRFGADTAEEQGAVRQNLLQAVTLLQAVGMNFLSPGPYIFWSLMAGPALVRGWQQSPTWGVGFLLGFYGALVGGTAALIVLFGAARRFGPAVQRILLGLSALALLGFGTYQLWQGIVG